MYSTFQPAPRVNVKRRQSTDERDYNKLCDYFGLLNFSSKNALSSEKPFIHVTSGGRDIYLVASSNDCEIIFRGEW